MRGGPTAIRSDVLVLGSTLGALVAASVLARSGLRVVLLEEEAHAKRPPLLREPFALTGLLAGEPIDVLLRELKLPLLERRELVREEVGLQVAQPSARIDVGRGREALARELETFGIAPAEDARSWLEALDAAGDEERARLLDAKPGGAPTGGLVERWGGLRATRPRPAAPPAPPPGLESFVDAQLAPCSGLVEPRRSAGAALLLRGLRDGAFRASQTGRLFVDIFRRRFLASHGEIRSVGRFGLSSDRHEVSVELPRRRLFARAAIVGAPRALLCRHVEQVAPPPRWLRGAAVPVELPQYLLRAEHRVVPVGMASRLVRWGPTPQQRWWLSRTPDPDERDVEWIVLRGLGAVGAPWQAPLAEIAPFSEGGIYPVPTGPTPEWDRDGPELRFPEPRMPLLLKRRPPIAAVGPEVAAECGVEGEVLTARQVADHLLERLHAPRRAL